MVIGKEMQRDITQLSPPGFWRRNIQPFVLGIASLALFAAGWALVGTIGDLASRQFEAESRAAQTRAEFELYRAIIWLKDSTNFINSGADGLVGEKLRGNPNSSRYIHSLGYIEVASGKAVDLLRGTRRTTAFSPQVSSTLLAQIDDRRGSVFAFDARSQADILGKVPPKTLLLMQVQPLASHDERISYVSFDVEGLCRDLIGHGQFARISRLMVRGEGYALPCTTRPPGGGIASYLKTRTWSDEKYVSDNLYIDLATYLTFPVADELALVCAVAAVCLLVIVAAAVMTGRWRRRTRAVLLSALDEAASSSVAKGEFLANMSHEIRTPMNGVMGMAELLARSPLDSNQQRYVRQIQSSGSALLAILNDVLDLSKIDQGKLAIDPIKTDIRALVQDILQLYTGNAEENSSSLLLDISRHVPVLLLVDPTRIRQVVGNLVSNAVKFTSNGEILVQLDVEEPSGADPRLVIRVLDNGIGIAAEQQERLFERFSQAEAGTARKFGGTGLGLSIVQQLVELMDGAITVSSELGKGATFTVRLPLVRYEETVSESNAIGCGVALISPSHFVETIVLRTLGDACIDVCVFKSFAEAMDMAGKEEAPPYFGLIIDEARDVHAAWEGWQALRAAGGVLEGGWSVLLADHQSHPRYRDFDKTVSKPFSASELIQHISALIQSSKQEARSVQGADVDAAKATTHNQADGVIADRDAGLFAGRKCLVVDDNTINQLVVSEMLQPLGFDLDVAGDGRKAITAAQAKAYDIIFMDCRMPNMDGYEATRQLCRMMEAGEIARVPIVALTANAMKGDREECLAAGMTAFLSKPVQMPELSDVLYSLVTPAMHDMGGQTDWFTDNAREEGDGAVEAVQGANATPEATACDAKGIVAPLGAGQATPQRRAMPRPQFSSVAPTADQLEEKSKVFGAIWTSATERIPLSVPADAPVRAGDRRAVPQAPVPAAAPVAAQEPAGAAEVVPCAILDLEVFRRLKATMRSHATLVEIYKADGYDYLRQIEEAFALEDLQAAILPVHTLKSSSKIMGANAMVRIAASLETALRQPEMRVKNSLQRDLERLKAVFASTVEMIEAG